ncbi:Fc.00g041880.m01.CDS01 [Cosmosporella sp. VM-42]
MTSRIATGAIITALPVHSTESRIGSEKNLSERLERIEDALARTLALKEEATTSLLSASDTSTPSSSAAKPPFKSTTSLGEQCATLELKEPLFIDSPSANSTTSISYGQIHYAGCHLGQISCHTGIPLFSEEGQRWIYSRTGDDTSFERLSAFGARQRFLPPTLSASRFHGTVEQLYELPERVIVEESLDWFYQSAFRLVFPVIDRVLFEVTIAKAYEPWEGQPSLEAVSAKGCVLAFLSIMCIFHGDFTPVPLVDSDACAIKAHYLLADILEHTSLMSLETVFMLHMHQTFSGRLQSAAMLHAISCRIVFMLGGHTHKNIKPFGADVTHKERETRHLRMLFWLNYIFDKDIALRTGQPPIMPDDYCDLTFPDGYLENHFAIPALGDKIISPSYSDESLVPYLPGDLRLSKLKDKTCRMLYSAQALRKSDAEILHDIRELDDELESWRLSVPLNFRPALSISQNPRLEPRMQLPQSMHRIGLHLEYHYLMATIHTASGRCYTMNPQPGFDGEAMSSGVNSSIALSLEASRSTLFYLRAAVDGLASEAFWIIVFYPTAAVMTLFFNILMNPLDPQAKEDLELLSSAADLIRSMPIRRLTSHEIGHIKMVDDFVAELIRLGNCAILKQTREREQRKSETRMTN